MSEDEPTEPWYADGLAFQCTSCGVCCKGPHSGTVAVDADEIAALAEQLELSVTAFGRRYLRRLADGEISLTEHPVTKDCCFWEDAVGCTVYAVRPLQCRQFPFWPEVVASRAAWDAESATCPGMDTGRTYAREEIERIAAGKRGTRKGRRRRLPSA